jgi:hypothetical protein
MRLQVEEVIIRHAIAPTGLEVMIHTPLSALESASEHPKNIQFIPRYVARDRGSVRRKVSLIRLRTSEQYNVLFREILQYRQPWSPSKSLWDSQLLWASVRLRVFLAKSC